LMYSTDSGFLHSAAQQAASALRTLAQRRT